MEIILPKKAMAVEISLCIVMPGAGCKKRMCGGP